MTLNDPDQTDVPDSYAASVLWGAENVPTTSRSTLRPARSQDDNSQELDDRISAIKAQARAEGYAAGRAAGISEISAKIVNELTDTLNKAVVVGPDSRGYKSGIVLARAIVERTARTF